MKQLNKFKKATLAIALFFVVLTLSSCGKKTSSYEGITDDVYAKSGEHTITNKELYDLLKYQKQGFTFTSSNNLDELKEELIFSPWTAKVTFTKKGDALKDAKEEELNVYEKDVKEIVDKAVYGTSDKEEIEKLSDKAIKTAKIKFLDSFVSKGIVTDNIYDEKILDTYKLTLAKKDYARELLKISVQEEFIKDKKGKDTDEENEDYISNEDVIEYFESNYENKNPLDALLIKFTNKNEADQTLRLFGDITVDGVEYRGLKSYKNRLYLVPKPQDNDGKFIDLTYTEHNEHYKDYTVTSSSLALDEVIYTNEGNRVEGLAVLVEFVKMYRYMYEYKTTITEKDIEDLAKSTSLETAINKVKEFDNNAFNYEYDELNDINSSLRTYLYNTLVATPEEGQAISYRYSSSPRSYNSNYYLMYKLTDQVKSTFDPEKDTELDKEIREKLFDEKLTDSYVTEKTNELMELVSFKIYDPEIELIYTLNNSDFKTTKDKSSKYIANIKVKADEELLVEKAEYNITPVQFFEKLEKVAGPSFAFNSLAEKALLNSSYAEKVTADDKQEFKENFKAVIDSFSNNYFASYGLPASMGRKNFIKLYFNADSIEEALDTFYMTSHVLTEYLEDIYAHYGEGEKTLKALQKYSENYYNAYYSASANHFLTYLDIDEDGNPDDPKDYLETLSDDKKAEFKQLVFDFNKAIYDEAAKKSGSHSSTFSSIITEFEESTRFVPSQETCDREPSLVDCKWAKYKKAGLNVKTEDLSTITNESSLSYDEAFIAKFEELLNSQNNTIHGQYMQPIGTSYDDLLTSTFGWHIIVLTGTTDQLSAQFKESDDDFEGKQYYNNIVYYEDGKEITLNAYNNNNYPSLNQIDIYLRERAYSNGIENLPSSVKTAMEATFAPVMKQFDSDQNKLFLLRSYLLGLNATSKDGITFTNSNLETLLNETFKVTVRSSIGYDYLENIEKNPVGTWFKDLYKFEA
jgi:hypothetical protein